MYHRCVAELYKTETVIVVVLIIYCQYLNIFCLCFSLPIFAITGASARERYYCQDGFCITLTEGEITAEAGLCVVIPCSFTTDYDFTPKNIVWYKCEPFKEKCGDSDHRSFYNSD